MKALFELFRRFNARRIFGFIRRLGGMSRPKVKCYDLRSTRALRVEGDGSRFYRPAPYRNFYPRPPGGRRRNLVALQLFSHDFYPRSPGGGRLENSSYTLTAKSHFYPRPPGGGRQVFPAATANADQFLSTPSGWRATFGRSTRRRRQSLFLSTPSGWRATQRKSSIPHG